MAKDEGRDVSIHLKLADEDFSSKFSQLIGGITDQLNKAGKQFAAQMESAEKSIRSATESIGDSVSRSPSSKAKGESGTDRATKAVARANRLIQQMEKESIDAAKGASRVGREYEEVEEVVKKLIRATANLEQAGSSGKLTDELSTQNRLRKQSEKTINQLIKKVKDLGRTEEISGEKAEQVLNTLREASARYSDERIKATKAVQSVERKSLSQFRRMMRSRVDLVEALPGKHEAVLKRLREEKKELLQQVEANEDNVEALERYRAVQKTIEKVEKSDEQFRDELNAKRNRQKEERDIQEQKGAEMAFVKELQQAKKRVRQELDEIQGEVESRDIFESLKGSIFGDEGLSQEKKQLQQLFSLMDGEGEEAAEGLLKAQKRRLELIEEEIDELMRQDATGEELQENAVRLNNLEEDRLQTLRAIEQAEEQIARAKNNQTAEGTRMATGRRQRRKNMKKDGTFGSYNAALQTSRLVQDAPYGLMGMVNNIDMAYESMSKLIAQSNNLGEALNKMAFGAGAASGMLWINALSSATIILGKHLDLSEQLGKSWDSIRASIFGAGDAVEELEDKIAKATKKKVTVVDDTSLAKAQDSLQVVEQLITKQQQLRAVAMSGPAAGEGAGSGMAKVGAWLVSFFGGNEDVNKIDERIKRLEGYKETIGDFVSEAMGMRDAYEGAEELGILTVKEHANVVQEVRSQREEMLDLMMAGLDGEDQVPFKKNKIKLRYEQRAKELTAMMQKYQRQLSAARRAGSEEEVKILGQLTDGLQAQMWELPAARDRELAGVGAEEDAMESDFQSILDLRRKNEKQKIKIEKEGFEERRALARENTRQQRAQLRESLDAYLEEEGNSAEDRKAMRAETAQAIEQAEKKLQQNLTEIEEEEAKRRQEARQRRAEDRLSIERQRVDLTMGGDEARVEKSRLKRQKELMQLERDLQKAQGEGNQEDIAIIEDKMDLARDLHEQRVAQIRRETQERSRQHDQEIANMTRQANMQGQIIGTYLKQQDGALTEFEGRMERLELRKQQAMGNLRGERDAQLGEVDEFEENSEDTPANEMKAFQKRLDILEWFGQERENIINDFQEREEEMESQHSRKMAQLAARQLSSNLGNISQALDNLQKSFVAKRKKSLMEQGVAEEEAARRAEEAGKRRFAIKKKIAIAEALVNTFQASMQVFNNTPGELTAKLAAAATALTYGFAQVAKIRAQSIGGGGQSGGGVSVSGLGSSTSATGSQVTDQSSPFASDAGLSTNALPESGGSGVKDEVKGLRKDMNRHTEAIQGMKSEAVIEDDTVIEVGNNYQDHKDEDTY